MNNKQIIKNILLALILWCTGTLKTTIDEKNLNTIALIQGYGYKYANLRELETLCASMHDKAYTLAVPIFVGIPSGTVQQFLKDLNPFGYYIILEKHHHTILSNSRNTKADIKDQTIS